MSGAPSAAELAELLGLPPARLDPEAALRDLCADSLELAEWVARLEERYALVIPDADLEGWRRLRDLEAYLAERLGGPGSG